jgi:hypothetical protein
VGALVLLDGRVPIAKPQQVVRPERTGKVAKTGARHRVLRAIVRAVAHVCIPENIAKPLSLAQQEVTDRNAKTGGPRLGVVPSKIARAFVPLGIRAHNVKHQSLAPRDRMAKVVKMAALPAEAWAVVGVFAHQVTLAHTVKPALLAPPPPTGSLVKMEAA